MPRTTRSATSSGVCVDGVGVERVGGVEVAGEGSEAEGRGAAVGDQEVKGAQRDGVSASLRARAGQLERGGAPDAGPAPLTRAARPAFASGRSGER